MNKRMGRAPATRAPRTSLPADIFERAFHHSPAMQSVVRASDGVLVEVNETFLKKLGFTREEVVGHSPLELNFWVHPEELARYRSELATNGLVHGREVALRSRDGRDLTVLLSTHSVELDGAPHFLSAGVDVSLRKEAEAKLRESERRLRESEARFSTAFRASPALMTIARLEDGGYVEVNDAFVRWLGIERSRILGHSWQEFAMWDDAAAGERFFEELLRTKSVRDVECELRRCDGSQRVLLVSADVIEINDEPHVIGFAIDVTERKRAEAELQNALAKERELNQLKSDFVSLVSHEFRTPLEVIMSSAENLERYHDRLPQEKRTHLLRTIHKSVRRMAEMMEEVLLLGRLESGATVFQPTTIDIASLCQRVCDEMESATNNRCPITLKIATPPGYVRGDEAVLRHILTNLLSNAVKYSEPGRSVEFTMGRDGTDAVFCVSDHGCGIPVADQARLFHAFHRGSNVRHVPGTGLGLVIVQRSVVLHGGTISCESEEGQGTTFTVRLPLFRGGATR